MLNVIYLLAIILGISGQNIVKKPYTQKTDGKGVYLFSTLLSCNSKIKVDTWKTTMYLPFSYAMLEVQ